MNLVAQTLVQEYTKNMILVVQTLVQEHTKKYKNNEKHVFGGANPGADIMEKYYMHAFKKKTKKYT